MRKVLIVDDDRATSAGMADVVEEWGYEAEVADTVKAGWTSVSRMVPDVAIGRSLRCKETVYVVAADSPPVLEAAVWLGTSGPHNAGAVASPGRLRFSSLRSRTSS